MLEKRGNTAEKKDAELQNIIAEQKLRTQRILGELIADGQRKGAIATPKDTLKNVVVSDNDHDKKKLAEIGLTKQQSSNFQAIASIPEDDFEGFIQEKKEAVNNAVAELTTSGAVRLAKSLQQKKDDLDVVNDIGERLAAEKELKELAKEINMKYTKEQRAFFVSLIKY